MWIGSASVQRPIREATAQATFPNARTRLRSGFRTCAAGVNRQQIAPQFVKLTPPTIPPGTALTRSGAATDA
jgi:hypothetical protein